jgi:hypothetical protein
MRRKKYFEKYERREFRRSSTCSISQEIEGKKAEEVQMKIKHQNYCSLNEETKGIMHLLNVMQTYSMSTAVTFNTGEDIFAYKLSIIITVMISHLVEGLSKIVPTDLI